MAPAVFAVKAMVAPLFSNVIKFRRGLMQPIHGMRQITPEIP